MFDTRPQFTPSASGREFTVVVSDAHLPLFGRILADLVHEEAPGVRLRFEHSTARLVGRASEQLPTVDALVLPQGLLSDVPHLDLYQDRLVCVVAAGTAPAAGLTIRELADRPWVLPYDPRSPMFSALHRLHEAGIEPRAGVSTEDFLAVPHLVARSDRIGLMPERAARLVGGVEVPAIPFELGVLVEALWWHPMHDRDPAHQWFRRIAVRAARRLEGEATPGTSTP